jgi:hypothetical protein
MITVVVLLLMLLALLGVPLFVSLGAGSLLAVWQDNLDPAVLVVEMMRLASSPNLMAIPLFTLTGVVLSGGGAAQRQIRLFNALFGWMPAGLAVVSVASCAFFTAFSGASGVTILALGGLLYTMLKREGYGERFSLGLVTSSGSIGLLFPPSLVVLLYGIVAGVSIEQLFMAGIVPGIVLHDQGRQLQYQAPGFFLGRGGQRAACRYLGRIHAHRHYRRHAGRLYYSDRGRHFGRRLRLAAGVGNSPHHPSVYAAAASAQGMRHPRR